MDLKEQAVLGNNAGAHWYYRAKSAAMLRLLDGTRMDSVLDVGAGSGFFSRYLLDHTQIQHAVCVDPNYAAEHDEVHNGKPIRFVQSVASFPGSLMLMMDVLEHVPDDTKLLANYAGLLPTGARILITVPALQWMWSAHDEFLEHYRRYTVSGVNSLVHRAGLTLIASHYYYGLTLPIAAAVRFGKKYLQHGSPPGSDMQNHSAPVNALLWQISKLELAFMRTNRFAGLSVFALAEKT